MKSNCCQSKLFRTENQFHICTNTSCANYLGETSLTHSKHKFWNKIFTGFLALFILLFTYNDYSSTGTSGKLYYQFFKKKAVDCNEHNLIIELQAQHIVCPAEVLAQIILESGHMTSVLFKRTNNLLGMRYPLQRTTTAIGLYLPDSDTLIKGSQKELLKYAKQDTYAVYSSWQDCVADYKCWQDKYFKLTDRYLSFLANCYAEDANYAKKIKSVIR